MSRRRSNDVCWCGSGRKLKRCHGAFEAARRKPVELGIVGPDREIPASIQRPPYIATGGVPAGPREVEVFDAATLPAMRHAGQVAAEVLLTAGAAVRPGVTTAELDAIAHETYLRLGAYPSTVGYRGFRKSVCTSVNEVACHGIPDSRPLQDGDIVNIDVTAYIDGVHGDTSATFAVGELDVPTAALVQTTAEVTLAGIAAVGPGRPLRVVGQTIEPLASDRGFGVISMYGGHGIGHAFHGFHVHHVDDKSDTLQLVPGMTFTVEPMLTAGTTRLRQWEDGWTEVTTDGLPSAQFEHTIVVTDDGVEILTVTPAGDSAVRWPN